jgi:hypothetical protein
MVFMLEVHEQCRTLLNAEGRKIGMEMMTINKITLKGSAATSVLAMFMATGAPAFAQATVDLEFSNPPTGNVATVVANADAVEDQLNSGAVGTTVSGNTVNVTATNSGQTTMSSVTGVLSDNAFSSTASANVTEANVLLDLAPTSASYTAAIGVIQDTTSSGSATATSANNAGQVVVEGTSPGTDEVTFTGTILADNNDISATANGNVGVTKIAVSGGVSLTGTASGAVVVIDESLAALSPDSDTAADLLISSAQKIEGTVTATSTNDDMTVILQSVSGATATLSNSDVSAAANGNDYTTTLSITDGSTNSIGASAALTALQNTGAAVSATTEDSDITLNTGADSTGAMTGNTGTATLAVKTNTQTATAYGNDSAQALSIVANALAGDVSSASLSDSVSGSVGVQLSAAADLVVASVQTQSAAVSATNSGNTIAANVDDEDLSVADTTVSVTSNTQSAFGMGADATNTLTIASNGASATGAVAAVQSNDGSVSATTDTSNVYLNVGRDGAPVDVAASTLELSSNTQSATAVGAQAVNTLTLSSGSNNLSVAANSGSVGILADAVETADAAQPTVSSAYALSNDQSSAGGSVSATVTGSDIDLVVLGNIAGTTVSGATTMTAINDSNTQSATAYGLTAGNAISLSFNNLEGTATTTADGAVLAGVANQQTQSGAGITATNTSEDSFAVLTDIDGSVTGSSLSTSSNTVSASAFGNRTTANSVTIAANNMTLASGQVATPSIDETTGDIVATADVVAASSQEFENSSVSATQVSGGTSNWIYTDVSGPVGTSSVVSNSNTLSVAATANSASNATSIGTVTTSALETSSAVANYQDVTGGTVTAALGSAGTAATPGYSSSNGATNNDFGAGDVTEDGADLYTAVGNQTLTFESATSEEIALLEGTFGAGNVSTSGTTTTVQWNNAQQVDLGNYQLAITSSEFNNILRFNQAASPYVPNSAGVIVETAGASITDSTITVMSNSLTGAVTGNTATNNVTATATTLTSNNTVDATVNESGNTVVADHALSSVQEVDDTTTLTSNVFGAFGSLQAVDQAVSGSTIDVSSNTQSSTGTANSVTNTVSLTGSSGTNANSALFSEQTSNGDVTTGSDMEVFANVGMNASTLSLNSNVNESVATSNSATNTTRLTSANAATVLQSPTDGTISGSGVSADQVLVSDQTAAGESGAVATAATTVFNNDLTDETGLAVTNSTVSMNGNKTTAQAISNSATNSVTLDVDNLDATGALANYQTSTQPTFASTTTSVRLSQQNSGAVSLLSGSTASADGNSAMARATGNSSTNTVTLAGTNVDAGTVNTNVNLTTSGTLFADAAFLLLNDTSNAGAVTANSTSNVYQIDLLSSGGTVLDSTASLSSNSVQAQATGNSASNIMNIGQDGTMTSISSNAGVVNSQSNTASIEANASATVQATIDTLASSGTYAVSGTSISLNDNSTVALARGNVSTNLLNVTSTGADGGNGTGTVTAASQTVQATYGALNAQTNNGAVTGEVSGASYQTLLNQGSTYAGGGAASGANISVTGNTIQAYGYGNISTNGVTLSAMSGGGNDATIAAGNIQTNTGAIGAIVTGSNIGTTSLGQVTGSNLSVGGNSLSATAVGNFAVTNVIRN